MRAPLSLLVVTAIVLFLCGFGAKALRFLFDVYRLGLGSPARSPSPFPNRERTFAEAFSLAAVQPYTTWRRTNPWMFYGHVSYHVGFFAGIASYFIVAFASLPRLEMLPPAEAFIRICMWTEYPELWPGMLLRRLFAASLVLACAGISVPLVLSILGKRGVIRPPYPSLSDGFTPLRRDPRWTSVRVQRKVVAVAVLVMDGIMLARCCHAGSVWLVRIHLAIFWSLVGAFPYTFLAHEIWRLNGIFRFARVKRGIAV